MNESGINLEEYRDNDDQLELEMAQAAWDTRIDLLEKNRDAMKIISIGYLITSWDLVNGRF